MFAGRLRHRVTVEQVTEAVDSFNEPDETWTTRATRWGEVLPQDGREFFSAQQINAEITHLVRMRYLAGVTPKMRLRLGTRIIKILSVINVEERSRELLISGQEVVQ